MYKIQSSLFAYELSIFHWFWTANMMKFGFVTVLKYASAVVYVRYCMVRDQDQARLLALRVTEWMPVSWLAVCGLVPWNAVSWPLGLHGRSTCLIRINISSLKSFKLIMEVTAHSTAAVWIFILLGGGGGGYPCRHQTKGEKLQSDCMPGC